MAYNENTPIKSGTIMDTQRTTALGGGGNSYFGEYGQGYDQQISELRFKAEKKKLESQINGTAGDGDPFGYGSYFGNASKFYDSMFDKQYGNTAKLMGLTNEYRTKEGATQGQMDEQAYRRQEAQLSAQKYLQEKDIGNQQYMQGRTIDNQQFMQGRELDTRKFLATTAIQENRDADLKRALSVVGRRINFR